MLDEWDDIEESAGEGGDGQLYEHLRMEVDHGQEPVRIDKFMAEHVQHSSRNRIQKAADAGFVFVNDKPVKSNYKVRPGDVITLMLDRPHYDTTIEPEDIPLDVVYEDDHLMVVNKPAGLVVHPPTTPAWDWYIALTRTPVDCWWWLRLPKPRRNWVRSSSTTTPIAHTRHWCGVTLLKTRDV